MAKPSPTPEANSSIYDDLNALSSQEIDAILDDGTKSKDEPTGDESDDHSSSKKSTDDSHSEATNEANLLSQDSTMAVDTLNSKELINMLINLPSLKKRSATDIEASPTLPSAQRARLSSRPDTADTEIAFQFTVDLKKAPINHAFDALKSAIDPLPVIPDDKKEIIIKKFSSLLHVIHKKETAAKRFDNVDWVPKPIRLKPFLSTSGLTDTEFIQEVSDEEKKLQESYITNMRKLMHKLAVEQLKQARTELLQEIITFTTNLARAYNTIFPSDSGESLGNVEYVAYDAIKVYNTETIKITNNDGVVTKKPHQRQLMYTLFPDINAGGELLKRLNLHLPADAAKFNENKRAHTASKYIKRILRSSIFTAHAAFQANLKAADKKLALAAIFDEKMKEQAATSMEMEFDQAVGPAQTEVVNQATKDMIATENEKLRQELNNIKRVLKNDHRGAPPAGAASKTKKDTGKASKKTSQQRSKKRTKKATKKAKTALELAEQAKRDADKALKALTKNKKLIKKANASANGTKKGKQKK